MSLAGSVVGNRYTIEREIGRGGMATVWAAADGQHGRKVAIKTLHPELGGENATARFLREIRLTAQLQHPAIVPVLDSGSHTLADGTQVPWFAMPFLDGESLRTRLTRETQLPVDEALHITNVVGRALEAAHRLQFVHRDIKPENIFQSNGQIYVIDFGVVRIFAAENDDERLTSTGLSIGTPAYMSPEQVLGGPVDGRSDQYSLATVLYEMLAGEPPFAGTNQRAIIARRLAEAARPLVTVRSTVPLHVESAIMRALERTPADRFPTIDAFLTALATPTGPVVVRRPRRAWVLAGAALVVVAAAAWGVASRRDRIDPELLALYQRGVQAYDTRTPAGAADAAQTFSQIISRDSGFAPAFNALAKTYVRAHQRGFRIPDVRPELLLPRAQEAVRRALQLDQDNADAWNTQGMVIQQIDPTDVTLALRSVRRSIELDSTQSVTWHSLAVMTAESGDLGSAMEYWRTSVRLSPGYTQGLVFLSNAHYWRGEYDSAAVWADSAVRVDPGYILARQATASVEVERRNFQKAEANADAALKLAEEVEYVNALANKALVQARAGRRQLAQAQLLAAEVNAGRFEPLPPHSLLWIAEAQAAVGDVRKAVQTLGRYTTTRDVHFQLHLRCAPTYAPLERDSTFRAMLTIPRPSPGSHC